MTVYEVPNIKHCDIEEGSAWYRIVAHDGWFIHLHNGVEDTQNLWKRAVVLMKTTDFLIVEIRAEADLPEGSETAGTEPPTGEAYVEATEDDYINALGEMGVKI